MVQETRTGPDGKAEHTFAAVGRQAVVLDMVVEGTNPVAESFGGHMTVAARSLVGSRRLERRKTGHID